MGDVTDKTYLRCRCLVELTSWIISHRRPGVATSMSRPRSKIRRCFCADIPPTMAAILTNGGVLLIWLGPSTFPTPSLGGFIQELRWEETCKANSLVGARTKARRVLRLVVLSLRVFSFSVIILWRIGSPYAKVLPDPWLTVMSKNTVQRVTYLPSPPHQSHLVPRLQMV